MLYLNMEEKIIFSFLNDMRQMKQIQEIPVNYAMVKTSSILIHVTLESLLEGQCPIPATSVCVMRSL